MKKVVFLLGSMGSGKSTILKESKIISQDKYITYCEDFDILGTIVGADALHKYKKKDVLDSLRSYSGKKLVVAGIYYSTQTDVEKYLSMGFQPCCLFIKVPREEIYKRVIKRGGGSWNEVTYNTNLRALINFFKKIDCKKTIRLNTDKKHVKENYNYIKQL